MAVNYSINPGIGSWNGNSKTIVISGEAGNKINMPFPEKDGHTFVTWLPYGNTSVHPKYGKLISKNPIPSTLSDWELYDVAGSGKSSIKLEASTPDLFNGKIGSNFITCTGSAYGSYNSVCGIKQLVPMVANKTYYIVLIGIVPKGFTISPTFSGLTDAVRGWEYSSLGNGKDIYARLVYKVVTKTVKNAFMGWVSLYSENSTNELPASFKIAYLGFFDATGAEKERYTFGTVNESTLAWYSRYYNSYFYKDGIWVDSDLCIYKNGIWKTPILYAYKNGIWNSRKDPSF